MPPPDNVRTYLRFATVIPGIAVISFPLLCLFMSETAAIIALCACSILSTRHAQALRKRHPDEIRPKEFALRSRAFVIMKYQIVAMLVVYAAVAALTRNLVVSLYSGGLLLLSLVFLIHEMIEIAELRNNECHQAADRTAPSVTAPASSSAKPS